MLFSIVVALMVILIAAFWAYQGFFSSAIMFFESVVAAMLAFGFFEDVHGLWEGSIGPGIGLPLAFMLIFVVTLAIMRVLTDKLVPNNLNFNLYVDRAGGGVCGFFTGMVLVGSALVAIQMLPIGSGILGFERLQVESKGPKKGLPVEKGFLLKPDAFVVGVADVFSSGRFGGGNPLAQAKPDYLTELYSVRCAPQTEARQVVPADSLKVLGYWDFAQIDRVVQKADGATLFREFSTEGPADPRNKFIVCQVALYPSAAHPDRGGEIRFRVPQFRLVGATKIESGPGSKPEWRRPHVYLACGMSDIYTHKQSWPEVQPGQQTRLVRFSPLTDMILGPTQTKAVAALSGTGDEASVNYYQFDVAFEVPDDPAFEPWYIEFKRGARVELNKKMKLDKAPEYLAKALASGGASSSSSGSEGDTLSGDVMVGDAPRGRTGIADAVEERTGVFAKLPVALDKADRYVSGCLRGEKLGEGHFYVTVTGEEIDPDSRVTEFSVPPGKRMVQIGAEKCMPGSLFGKALNYAANVAAQVYVTSEDGTNYFAQGVYSLAPVDGRMIFEIQYWPQADIPERCLKKPKKVKPTDLKQAADAERKFGYVFLVDPGIRLVGFSAGRAGAQQLNIEVP
ncbi:MAG: CvpA family protein [Phycisphaerae bacterium]|nr:CvpA family protein [Phycisphaerae bacterium]